MHPPDLPLLLALLIACLAVPGASAAEPRLRLLETTDLHMNLVNQRLLSGQADRRLWPGQAGHADQPVPEPGALALVGLPLAGLSLSRRFLKRA